MSISAPSCVQELRVEADYAAHQAAGRRHTVGLTRGAERLQRAMQDRSAETHFGDGPVPVAQVLRAAASMGTIDGALWGPLADDLPLRILLACRSVDGLEPGLYEYRDGRATRVQPIGEHLQLREMVLQPEFADAAAIILAIGDLAGMTSRYGAHGHRMLLSRGGAACEAAWLTAVDAGLTGSIFAGFLPSALRAVAGIDGNAELQLLALALGAPR